jgi:hypothetical protein
MITTGPLTAKQTLVVVVAGVDSQKAIPIVATISGSAKSPFAAVPLTTATSFTGPGGHSFPCVWMMTRHAPIPIAGTVTGTIYVEFSEIVNRMCGMSAIISGTSGNYDGAAGGIAQHTDLPNFFLSSAHTTTGTNSVLVDVCMSEASNHQTHTLGASQTDVGNVFFTGPKYSVSLKQAPTPGTGTMSRADVGGPFAGVSLVILGLQGQ